MGIAVAANIAADKISMTQQIPVPGRLPNAK
jgi:hypothetical protein